MCTRIRPWHFILLPIITIVLLVPSSLYIQSLFIDLHALSVKNLYMLFGIQAIILMAIITSLVAWLAIRYRKNCEETVQEKTEELEKMRDYLYTIVNGSAEAIIGIDLNGKVTSWNKAAEEIYGYSAHEMLGEGLEKLLPEHLIAGKELAKIAQEVYEKGYIRSYVTERIRKDGQKIDVIITRTLLRDKNGKPIGNSAIVRDLTQLKELETKLIETERLAAIGELAASIAHEIKNPLAGIRGASEIIADSLPKDDRKLEMLTEIIHQIDRLDRTVKELLVFARPKPPIKVECNINDIINRVLSLLREDPSGENISFTSELLEDLPPSNVDPQQIEQLFFNVGLNSIQAMDHHGNLAVRTYVQDSRVCISFTDTGHGIPEHLRDQIFKPFFTTKSKGTGLGLPIVQKIVLSHGGDITIHSMEGKGTTFIISLPAERAFPRNETYERMHRIRE